MLAERNRIPAGPAAPALRPRFVRAKVFVLLLALWLGTAHAETLSGKVIKITDGDTITILTGKLAHRVRLSGVDAPEKGQPYGNRSRQNLAQLAYGKEATLHCHKTDRYKRKICKVLVQPADCPSCVHTLDVGLAQIIAGLAWWYREYAKELSEGDREDYDSGEQEAKARRRGLWGDKNPMRPWEWRAAVKGHRSEQGIGTACKVVYVRSR